MIVWLSFRKATLTYRTGCPPLFPFLLPAPARKSFETFEMGGRVGFP